MYKITVTNSTRNKNDFKFIYINSYLQYNIDTKVNTSSLSQVEVKRTKSMEIM